MGSTSATIKEDQPWLQELSATLQQLNVKVAFHLIFSTKLTSFIFQINTDPTYRPQEAKNQIDQQFDDINKQLSELNFPYTNNISAMPTLQQNYYSQDNQQDYNTQSLPYMPSQNVGDTQPYYLGNYHAISDSNTDGGYFQQQDNQMPEQKSAEQNPSYDYWNQCQQSQTDQV